MEIDLISGEIEDNCFHTDYLGQDLSKNELYKKWYKSKLAIVERIPNTAIIYCPLCCTYYTKVFSYREISNKCPYCQKRFCMGCYKERPYGDNCLLARIKYSLIYTNFTDYSDFFFGIDSYVVFFIFCMFFMPVIIATGFSGNLLLSHSKKSIYCLFDDLLRGGLIYNIYYFFLYAIILCYIIIYEICFTIIFIFFILPFLIIKRKVKKYINALYSFSMVTAW